MQWRLGSIGRHQMLCPWLKPCCSNTRPVLPVRCYNNTHINDNDDTKDTYSRAYCRFMITLLLVINVFIPLQAFRLAYILIHSAINMMCCLLLALGDTIIKNHCKLSIFTFSHLSHLVHCISRRTSPFEYFLLKTIAFTIS
jgi:hypothetical protein